MEVAHGEDLRVVLNWLEDFLEGLKKIFFASFFFFLKFTFTIFKSEVQKKYKIKSKDFLFTEFSQSRFHNLFVN